MLITERQSIESLLNGGGGGLSELLITYKYN